MSVQSNRTAETAFSRPTPIGEDTAFVVHEVKQPLTAILLNAEAALRWLTMDTPNLEEAKESLQRVIGNSRRAADVIRHVRDLVHKSPPAVASLDINSVIMDTLDLSTPDLSRHGIVFEAALTRDLAPINGDRVQL